MLGLAALGLIGLVAAALPALAVSALATLVLCGTAAWEWYTRACEVPTTPGHGHRA